jgi:hypothetical protein
MSIMLDRVAQAILNSGCGDDYSAAEAARAAIEAMREPTEEMREAAMTRWGGSATASPVTCEARCQTYSAMIDAALSPKS